MWNENGNNAWFTHPFIRLLFIFVVVYLLHYKLRWLFPIKINLHMVGPSILYIYIYIFSSYFYAILHISCLIFLKISFFSSNFLFFGHRFFLFLSHINRKFHPKNDKGSGCCLDYHQRSYLQ